MAFIIIRDIAKNINDSIFYSIIADEVIDCSNKEQFIINIPLSNARGQRCDGAKNLCDIKNGISKKILS